MGQELLPRPRISRGAKPDAGREFKTLGLYLSIKRRYLRSTEIKAGLANHGQDTKNLKNSRNLNEARDRESDARPFAPCTHLAELYYFAAGFTVSYHCII